MKTEFVICDKTANTGREYIGENGQNTSLEENAVRYNSIQESENVIEENGWQEWAIVIEL